MPSREIPNVIFDPRDALGEHERQLLDPRAREMGDLRGLDLEGVARAQQFVPVDRADAVGPLQL